MREGEFGSEREERGRKKQGGGRGVRGRLTAGERDRGVRGRLTGGETEREKGREEGKEDVCKELITALAQHWRLKRQTDSRRKPPWPPLRASFFIEKF